MPEPETCIHVLIADDHPLIRGGLRSLLEKSGEFQVVAEAADGYEAVELAVLHKPDVALLDVSIQAVSDKEYAGGEQPQKNEGCTRINPAIERRTRHSIASLTRLQNCRIGHAVSPPTTLADLNYRRSFLHLCDRQVGAAWNAQGVIKRQQNNHRS